MRHMEWLRCRGRKNKRKISAAHPAPPAMLSSLNPAPGIRETLVHIQRPFGWSLLQEGSSAVLLLSSNRHWDSFLSGLFWSLVQRGTPSPPPRSESGFCSATTETAQPQGGDAAVRESLHANLRTDLLPVARMSARTELKHASLTPQI